MRAIATAFLPLLLASSALAGEGKWTPQQVLAQGPAWVKAQGFGLPLERLWDEKAGGGLLANAVQLPGCSGSFVSAEGLLITNHHCAVDVLQEHSTPQANLYRDGYLARTRADERKASAFRIQVPRAFRDVTAEVLAAVPAGADDLARFKAVEAKQKALVGGVREAARDPLPVRRVRRRALLHPHRVRGDQGRPARLRAAPGGGQLRRGDRQLELAAPHRRLLAAAGLQGRPALPPRYFFPVSTKGVREGDAVAVLGYPGRSYRSWIADEMQEREERWFPAVRDLYGEWIRILGGGGRALPGGGDRGDRRPPRPREHAQERGGPARGPAPRADRREAAGRGRARARLGGDDARTGRRPGTPTRACGSRTPRGCARWERDFLLDMASPGTARPALAAHAGPPLDGGREAGRGARDRLHGARPPPPARAARAGPAELRRGRGPPAPPLVGEAGPRPARRAAHRGGGRGVRRCEGRRRPRRGDRPAVRLVPGLRPRDAQGDARGAARGPRRRGGTRCSTSASPSTRRGRPSRTGATPPPARRCACARPGGRP